MFRRRRRPDEMPPKVIPTTHCQICERGILANTGVIAHHGYQRPGHGWQTGSCFGARYKPFEVSCDAMPPYIAMCESHRDLTAAHIARMAEPGYTWSEIEKVRDKTPPYAYSHKTVEFKPCPEDTTAHAKYLSALDYKIRCETLNHAHICDEIARMQKRLANWKPTQVEGK